MDILKIKNTNKKENINNLSPDLLQEGEMALVRETNYEKLYIKNTDNEITPLHRIIDDGTFDTTLPTIQESWIDYGLAQWSGNVAAMNQVKFNANLTGNFTPPEVSNMDILTDMNQMFSGCTMLTSLDLSSFDTSNVTDMYGMFDECSGLTSLDVSSFNTYCVWNMAYMFAACTHLTSINVSSFDTSNVVDMAYMFSDCALTSLDVSNFDTSKVMDMSSMFTYLPLTSLDLNNFDTYNVSDMRYMFAGCTNLTSLKLNNFNISNVTDMERMFQGCNSLKEITCTQTFKDWCITNQNNILLPTEMRNGGSGTWIIV